MDLYLGEALAESGKPGPAATHLKRISQGNGINPRYQAIAKICLGLGYYRNNETSKVADLWRGIDASDPEVKAEIGAVYSKAGLADKNPSVMADGILSEMKRSGKPLSMRMVKNLTTIYARESGSIEKGLDLLDRSDLNAFSYREILGKSKVIHFYDLSLLNDMATLYGRASIAYLVFVRLAVLSAACRDLPSPCACRRAVVRQALAKPQGLSHVRPHPWRCL